MRNIYYDNVVYLGKLNNRIRVNNVYFLLLFCIYLIQIILQLLD